MLTITTTSHVARRIVHVALAIEWLWCVSTTVRAIRFIVMLI